MQHNRILSLIILILPFIDYKIILSVAKPLHTFQLTVAILFCRMRAEPSPEPRLEHVYVRRSGPGGGGGQPNSPVYAQIAKKRNSNNSSVAERIAQFEYQSKEIVRDSSPSVDQVRMEIRS